tara:strand:- start:146 stop:616 length:471 start_codon:yes stop_codon:yes gene_type:complete
MIEAAQKPELLTKMKKFSQMEMEMDKFLAKKSSIFNKVIFQNQFIDQLNSNRSEGDKQDETSQDQHLEFQIVKSILHLTLKSTIELCRTLRLIHPKMYNQMLADFYYFFVTCIFIVFVLFSGSNVNIKEFDQSMLLYKDELHSLSGLVNEVMSSID